MKNKIAAFMAGRYGNDELNKTICIMAIAFALISGFVKGNVRNILSIIGYALLFVALYRAFSRKINLRYMENAKYFKVKGTITGKLRKVKSILFCMKDYKIFVCPNCKMTLRVPRGKGKIRVKCPKCGTDFVKES